MRKPPAEIRTSEVVLDGRFQHSLSLVRTPPLLRFVITGDDWKTLDALDQLEDQPKPGERVIVAERKEVNPVHFKFSGKDKHKSGWYKWVKYVSLEDQPPEDVVRDTAKWQEWAQQRWANRDKSS